MSWSINQNKCVWSQVVESTSTATSRWSRCMTRVLREASVANIARLRAVTEQTHTCINTPPTALHLAWVFHIGAVLTCTCEWCVTSIQRLTRNTDSFRAKKICTSHQKEHHILQHCQHQGIVVMFKGVLGISGSSYLGKCKQRLWVSFDNFDKPDYPLFAPAAMLTRRFISEPSFLNSTKAYLPSAGSGAYLEKDERAVWSVWGHIFICHQPELSHE